LQRHALKNMAIEDLERLKDEIPCVSPVRPDARDKRLARPGKGPGEGRGEGRGEGSPAE
jgi:hypothetical protein